MKRSRILLLTSFRILSNSPNLCRTVYPLFKWEGMVLFFFFLIITVVAVVVGFHLKICL